MNEANNCVREIALNRARFRATLRARNESVPSGSAGVGRILYWMPRGRGSPRGILVVARIARYLRVQLPHQQKGAAMPELRPIPAWSLDGLPAEPEPPVQPIDALTGFFTLLAVIGFRVAQAAHQSQRHAARILAQ